MITFDILKNEPDVRAFVSGSTIFRDGEPGDLMFVVIEGQVELRKGNQAIRSLQPGEVFGEMSIIEDQPRSADAVAITDCLVAAISQKRFMLLVSQAPFFAVQMLRLLSERLRNETLMARGINPPS